MSFEAINMFEEIRKIFGLCMEIVKKLWGKFALND
jgi:hypothetical protein